ncbi:hypothetical protein FRC12_022635 [Ceratobasidium sp. 428]|nr:hypothetical protein FRC12_022635 [Ceratobasidium sp. 428]
MGRVELERENEGGVNAKVDTRSQEDWQDNPANGTYENIPWSKLVSSQLASGILTRRKDEHGGRRTTKSTITAAKPSAQKVSKSEKIYSVALRAYSAMNSLEDAEVLAFAVEDLLEGPAGVGKR